MHMRMQSSRLQYFLLYRNHCWLKDNKQFDVLLWTFIEKSISVLI